MAELLGELSRNEAIISALVGLLTLVTAVWGMTLLLLTSVRRTKTADQGNYSPGTAPGGRAPWMAILDRGLSTRSELDELISVRTTNVSIISIMGFSLGWIITGLYSTDYAVFAFINIVVFLIALLGFVIHPTPAGRYTRWLFLVALLFQWIAVLLFVGREWGIEYLMAGILLLPPLLFTRGERTQERCALGLCVAMLPLGLWLESAVDLRMEIDDQFRLIAYYANAAALAAVVALVLNFYNNAAVNSFHELEDQKAKSEALVRSILPEYVASRLAEDGATVADWHKEASVLFATVYGFQDLARRVSAVQLIELLSQLFLAFDELVEGLGVEKVNTLGTNYVVATGIGESHQPDHAALARLAIGMREAVVRMSESANHPFSLRIGMSTGQVVSGVIGHARPCFDIWGETVELANSLRGSALENTIVVNEATYWRLRDQFELQEIAGESGRYLLIEERS